MSKFFKALEKVEQEREATAAPPAPESPPRPVARVVPAPPPRDPRGGERVPRPVPERERRPDERPPERPVEPKPEPVSARTPAREPAPVAAESPAAPVTAPQRRGERSTVYGAPLARDARSLSGPGFGWQLEPAATGEPGDVDDHLVSLLQPTSFAAEQYRAVRLAIENFRHERGTRVVAVASPGRGDGRTMTALNLAGALAQSADARVVLLEADLRHPTVARYLGLPASRGLSAWLLDAAMPVDELLQRPPTVAFTVIPAGAASSMPYELLKSPRLASLLADLRERFDYVVVDTPPVLPFPDVGILRDVIDGVVLVARAHRTPRETLRDSLTVVGRQRALGLVFNDDERTTLEGGVDADPDGGWRRYVPRTLGSPRG